MMIAPCGINCAECTAYLATAGNDDELRRLTADKWRTQWNLQLEPNEINCLGCHSDMVVEGCRTCTIRSCPQTQPGKKCLDCETYPCDRVDQFRVRWKAH